MAPVSSVFLSIVRPKIPQIFLEEYRWGPTTRDYPPWPSRSHALQVPNRDQGSSREALTGL